MSRGPIALNEAVVVRLDGPLDPLRLTDRSVLIHADDGRPLASRRRVQTGALVVELVVDEQLLARPPAALVLTLVGLPSVHALGTLDGRRLGATARVVVDVSEHATLAPLGSASARLIAVGGHPVPLPASIAPSGSLTLVYEGVIDPSTVTPEHCPLSRIDHGLVLGEAVGPPTRWRCIGRRFELELDLSGLRGRYALDLRRFRVRDLSGGTPQPALKTELALS